MTRHTMRFDPSPLVALVLVAAMAAPQMALAACGGTFTSPTGTLVSPRYPKKYPSNQNCVYTILASPDARLKFWCDKLVIESSVGCVKDYISINGLYTCGKTKIKNMYGQGKLTIQFVSDSSVKKKGFRCYYERVTGGDYVPTSTTPAPTTLAPTTPAPTTPAPTTLAPTTRQETTLTTQGDDSGGKVPCSSLLTLKSEWNGGWNGDLSITVPTTMTDWKVEFGFSLPVTSFEQWTGTTTEHSNRWFAVSKNGDYHASGSTLAFSFLYRYPGDTTQPTITRVKLNGHDVCNESGESTTNPTPEGTNTPPTMPPGDGCDNYDEVLHKSLLFYEAQRSGYLPASNRVPWRRSSATDDALDAKTGARVELSGGYYDAGDYVKFGYPMAGAATVLAWGAIEYQAAYTAAGEMDNMLAAVKWATDYFIKAHTEQHVLYGQVGRGDLDHSYWGRPEDMAMERPAYKITESEPGSDLAGETSAALAAASILFRDSDSDYSDTCLLHAKQLYDFADSFRGKYSESIKDAANYYKSYGVIDDELAWAAVWLYRATGNRNYLTKAKEHYNNINIDGVGEFSWAEKTPGVQVLLAQLADASDKPTYKTHLQTFCDRIIDHTKRTPKNLVYLSKWGSLRYAANVAYICLRAADLGIKKEHYNNFGREQIHYMLGSTGRSYVVGFGVNPPQRPHHASSSCKDPPASCSWSDFHSSEPNPHVLYGALVGGPDEHDSYEDKRDDFISNEVTCDYNAGFQSAVAALRQLLACE